VTVSEYREVIIARLLAGKKIFADRAERGYRKPPVQEAHIYVAKEVGEAMLGRHLVSGHGPVDMRGAHAKQGLPNDA
jgi:hypothetical protein